MKRLVTTGIVLPLLILTLSPVGTLAATETEEFAIRVTAAQCEALFAPHAFSIRQKREHQEWHDMHEEQRATNSAAWVMAHTAFHREQHDSYIDYTRHLVACGKLMEMQERRSVSRFDILVLRPLGRRGFLPIRLTQTGGVPQMLQAEPRQGAPWRDARFARADRPSRRTIVQETLEAQEEGRRF